MLTFEGLQFFEVDVDAVDELGGGGKRLLAPILVLHGGGSHGNLLCLIHLVWHIYWLTVLRLYNLRQVPRKAQTLATTRTLRWLVTYNI